MINNKLDIFYSNEDSSLILYNSNLQLINSVQISNILGQLVYQFNSIENTDFKKLKNKQLLARTYIINLKTENSTITKKNTGELNRNK